MEQVTEINEILEPSEGNTVNSGESEYITPELLKEFDIKTDDDALKDMSRGDKEAQPSKDEEEVEEDTEKSPEDILKELSEETEQTAEAASEGMKEIEYEGNKYNIPSALEGAFMRQSDYTRKTQALAEERKAFESEHVSTRQAIDDEVTALEQSSTKHRAALTAFEQWDQCFNNMKTESPELYAEVDQYVKESMRVFNNPIMTRQLEALNQKIESLEGKDKERNHKSIRDDYQRQEEEFKKNDLPSFEKLGLHVDLSKVKNMFAIGVDREGKPFNKVKDAAMAAYANELAQLYKSKGKLSEVKQKMGTKKSPTAGQIKGSKGRTRELDFSKMSYTDITNGLANGSIPIPA